MGRFQLSLNRYDCDYLKIAFPFRNPENFYTDFWNGYDIDIGLLGKTTHYNFEASPDQGARCLMEGEIVFVRHENITRRIVAAFGRFASRV